MATLLALALIFAATGCGSTSASPAPNSTDGVSITAATGAPRTVETREDAIAGDPITPSDMLLEGVEAPGVVPAKQYFIAFSNGEMGNSFCRTHVDDFNAVAQQYVDKFGIRYEWTNAGNNSTQQLSDIQSLLAKRPDLLIVNPNEVEPLNVIVDWCEEAGIPLMIVDKVLKAKPGEKTLISIVSYDMFLQGVQIGTGVVDYLTEKYGEAKGDVAEIAGILGSLTSIERSQGMNLVFSKYPDINVVVSRAGEWDNSVSYNVSQDILTTFPEGTLDAVVGNCDESCLAFMEAAKAVGREDIGKGFVGADSPVAMLENILDGKAYATAENSPYYGLVTFEYAIRWLNGEEIPGYVMLPNRFFRIENEEQRAAMQEIVDQCREQGLEFVPVSMGHYDLFNAYPEKISEIYPTPNYKDPSVYEEVPYYETSPSTIR
ncbi:sugar ABC transporter substrate-binding protein [Anaerotruncus rubiinfantis]|uniref:sugar ABC transporter substrate-binding protein n=1 Tax=Anaerotruncus rubiinfantis TaxID=1720200 RepID=UPI0018978D3D|nr:sugar ABC transporter substrate-binding protein [Anaerotruncus rubiinfantis]